MAVYSRTLSDTEILALIPQQSKDVLIVTCGGCVNESLAYDNDVPILTFDDRGNATPFASYVEAVRISKVLKEKGYGVEIKLLDGDMPVLCIYTEGRVAELLSTGVSPDVILTLSCKSGAIGLQVITDKPVISITKQVGYMAYAYKDENGKRNIIKELSRCDSF